MWNGRERLAGDTHRLGVKASLIGTLGQTARRTVSTPTMMGYLCLLFRLIQRRYEKASLILTSNNELHRLGRAATAILDRLRPLPVEREARTCACNETGTVAGQHPGHFRILKRRSSAPYRHPAPQAQRPAQLAAHASCTAQVLIAMPVWRYSAITTASFNPDHRARGPRRARPGLALAPAPQTAALASGQHRRAQPWPQHRRNTSFIFLMDNLFAGICVSSFQ